MKRPIKFRAYIPALQITVYDIAVYNDGDILAGGKEFDDRLKEKQPDCHIDWDEVWDGRGYEGKAAVHRYDKDKNDYEEVLSFIPIDGSLLIYKDDCTISQYTGLNDSNGKEIYENDIIELRQSISDLIKSKKNKTLIKIDLLTVYFRNQRFLCDVYNNRASLTAGAVPLRTMLTLTRVSSSTVVGSLPLDRSLIFNQNEE